jgi:hypothetical protein
VRSLRDAEADLDLSSANLPNVDSIYPKRTSIPGVSNPSYGWEEDPHIWYSAGVYHVIYSGSQDRVGYHLYSTDGLTNWKDNGYGWSPRDYQKLFCYEGSSTCSQWYKMERPGVVLENGHPTHITWAVADVDKDNQIPAGSNHGSKVIVVPFDGVAFDADFGSGGTGGTAAAAAARVLAEARAAAAAGVAAARAPRGAAPAAADAVAARAPRGQRRRRRTWRQRGRTGGSAGGGGAGAAVPPAAARPAELRRPAVRAALLRRVAAAAARLPGGRGGGGGSASGGTSGAGGVGGSTGGSSSSGSGGSSGTGGSTSIPATTALPAAPARWARRRATARSCPVCCWARWACWPPGDGTAEAAIGAERAKE